MKTNRDDTKNIEAKRLEQIRYIMEHWGRTPRRDFRDALGELLKPLKIF